MPLLSTILAVFLILLPMHLRAAEAKDPETLAKESEAKCAATAKDAADLTPQMVIDKVTKAAALVEAEGPASFDKFKGTDSEFLFAGTYIWIHDLDGTMHMHPIKYKMEGRNLINLKDRNGFMLFVEMNKKAEAEGDGWVQYVWPKPGEKDVSPKTSYVTLAPHDGIDYVVGCGVYDWTLEKVKAALDEEE